MLKECLPVATKPRTQFSSRIFVLFLIIVDWLFSPQNLLKLYEFLRTTRLIDFKQKHSQNAFSLPNILAQVLNHVKTGILFPIGCLYNDLSVISMNHTKNACSKIEDRTLLMALHFFHNLSSTPSMELKVQPMRIFERATGSDTNYSSSRYWSLYEIGGLLAAMVWIILFI